MLISAPEQSLASRRTCPGTAVWVRADQVGIIQVDLNMVMPMGDALAGSQLDQATLALAKVLPRRPRSATVQRWQAVAYGNIAKGNLLPWRGYINQECCGNEVA